MGSYANGSTSANDVPPSSEEIKEPAFPLKTMPLHANGWLNDMKISSPTAIRVNIGNPSAFDPIYRAWTVSFFHSPLICRGTVDICEFLVFAEEVSFSTERI
jgi:trehalose 6-phosphate phosphatase